MKYESYIIIDTVTLDFTQLIFQELNFVLKLSVSFLEVIVLLDKFIHVLFFPLPVVFRVLLLFLKNCTIFFLRLFANSLLFYRLRIVFHLILQIPQVCSALRLLFRRVLLKFGTLLIVFSQTKHMIDSAFILIDEWEWKLHELILAFAQIKLVIDGERARIFHQIWLVLHLNSDNKSKKL